MISLLSPNTLVAQRFCIEKLAGSGGMSSIYRACDLHTRKPVAIKVLHCANPTAEERERFAREAQLLASLFHPGIVRYIAHGQTPDGTPFLAMEWLEGEDLERILKKRNLSLSESLLLIRTIAEALAVAHRRGIVHRDLKPANLFLRGGCIEESTILDFGVARHAQHTKLLTRVGVMVGTPGYMAPEQVQARTHLTPAADIFALGCVLFECLAGRQPFFAECLEAILVKILFEPTPPLRELCGEIPDALLSLIERMLCKDPACRIQDAAALLDELDAFEASRGANPRQPASDRSKMDVPRNDTEAQLVSVLAGWLAPPPGETLDPVLEEECRLRLHSVTKSLQDLGIRSEILPDRTLLATVSSTSLSSATAQAKRAAHCALLLRKRLPEAVVAVATGKALLKDQWPVGEAITRAVILTRAHRNHSSAKPAPILIDAMTAGLLDSQFETRPLASDVVALLGEREDEKTRLLLGRPTTCVGRDIELATLNATLDACIREEMPHVLLVMASPGTGKSRLRHEFVRRARMRAPEVRIVLGRGNPLFTNTPFFVLRQALLHLFGIAPDEDIATQQDKLRQQLGAELEDHERERTVTFLGELCGIPFPDSSDPLLGVARKQPRMMEELIRRAFLCWLRGACALTPVVLVIEDLHFCDLATVQFIDVALRVLDDARLFVLALSRPAGQKLFPNLWPQRSQVLRLYPLSRRGREQMVRHALGCKTPNELVAQLVEQSAGNPLYLEELIRAAACGKAFAAPETVMAMLQMRMGHLASGARRALRAASVFGEVFSSAGVAMLLGGDPRSAERWLDYLVAQEFIERKEASPCIQETEYQFRHTLMRDAAYETLSTEERALSHSLAARYLESASAQPTMLAYHFQHAGNFEKALLYYEKAEDEAAKICLRDETRRHFNSVFFAMPQDAVFAQMFRHENSRGLAVAAQSERRGPGAIVPARSGLFSVNTDGGENGSCSHIRYPLLTAQKDVDGASPPIGRASSGEAQDTAADSAAG